MHDVSEEVFDEEQVNELKRVLTVKAFITEPNPSSSIITRLI